MTGTAAATNAGHPVAAPVDPGHRMASLDVLRGVAICGILLMNVGGMGAVSQYPRFPIGWTLEWVTWGVQSLFVQGAMRGLFTLLFGAGMMLMLRHAEGEHGRVAPIDVWVRRSIALMALGLIQWVVFLWPGEILWNYGISALFLLAFRTARPRTLLLAAALSMTALAGNGLYRTWQQAQQLQAGAAAMTSAAPLTPDMAAAVEAARRERAAVHPDAATVSDAIAARTHLRPLLRWSADYWTRENIGVTGWLDIVESVGFMLIGIALFRGGILTGQASGATYRRMMVWGYTGGLVLRGAVLVVEVRSGLLMSAGGAPPIAWALADAVSQPARLLVTIGHLGLVMTLFRAGWLGQATPLRALGRMTLSVYCLQSILGSAIFYGLGLVGRFALPALWAIAAGIWIATALFSRWWLARFAMGPAESVLRAVAYGTTAPIGARPSP